MKSLLLLVVFLGCAVGAGQMKTNPIKDCGDAPKCVSTKAVNPKRAIPPIHFTGNSAEFIQIATAVIESMPRSKIVSTEGNYIRAEFKSSVMKFIDDFEIYYDESNSLVDARSSARVGYYDFGVNAKRFKDFEIEFLKKAKK